MKTATPASTETYASAYARLSQIAERLKTAGTSANVDSIVEDLRAARIAYSICKARLDAIRREVDAEIETGGEATAA